MPHNYDILDAKRLARNAAGLLNGEGAGGNLTPEEALPAAIDCLRSALSALTQQRTDISVILCKDCEGHGYTSNEVQTDYHKREYVTQRTHCNICGGSGRFLMRVVTELSPIGVVAAKRIADILEMDIGTHNLTKAGCQALAKGVVEGLKDHDE